MSEIRGGRLVFVMLLGLICAPLSAQGFEAASVKLNRSGERGYSLPPPVGAKYSAGNASLKLLVLYSYHLQDVQLAGASGWMNSDRYDIEARAEAAVSEDRVRLMMQALLADRFDLKVHWETRELSTYSLVTAKKGIQMPQSKGDCSIAASATVPCGGLRLSNRSRLTGNSVPLPELVEMLSALTGRAVIDKTGLSGAFDISLQWTPDEGLALGAEPGAPSVSPSEGALFTALQEQLGLQLRSEKAPVSVLIIDSAQKPSEN